MTTIVPRVASTHHAELTDDELTHEALAAVPDEVAADAVCFWDVADLGRAQPLPEWYMPAPIGVPAPLRGWRRRVVYLVIAAFLTITAYGLCNTYGQLGLHGG